MLLFFNNFCTTVKIFRFSAVSIIIKHIFAKSYKYRLTAGATDSDTADNNITFTLSPIAGQGMMGFISLKSRPTVPVHSFTQEDLARSKVLFTHTGIIFNILLRLRDNGYEQLQV